MNEPIPNPENGEEYVQSERPKINMSNVIAAHEEIGKLPYGELNREAAQVYRKHGLIDWAERLERRDAPSDPVEREKRMKELEKWMEDDIDESWPGWVDYGT